MSSPGTGKEVFSKPEEGNCLRKPTAVLFPRFPGRQNTGVISPQTFQLTYTEYAPTKQAISSTKGVPSHGETTVSHKYFPLLSLTS